MLLALCPVLCQAQLQETLLETSQAWGSAIADYNGDGHDDIFITGHDRNDRIWYWTPGGYVPSNQVFKYSDRHDCDAADFNRDGRMDLFCTIGADRGEGSGPNELWLQNAKGVFVKMANHGAEDVYGSGRYPIFFDLNNDGYPDLFLTNATGLRTDGKPSINRIFLNRGGVDFVEVRTLATSGRGWGCVAKGDINGDGWDDLVLCTGDALSDIYINNGQNDFVELASPAITAWRDAKLFDMNNDGRQDLVVLTSKNKLQVWLNSGSGNFFDKPAMEASFAPLKTMALAIGDFTGDGLADIYVVLKQEGCVLTNGSPLQDRAQDVLFSSQGIPGQWSRRSMTQNFAGCGQAADVVDGNKVLLLNGGDQYTGPNYLLGRE